MNIEIIDKTKICAVIITYNGRDVIDKTIKHILLNKIGHIVVIDNNSIDGTKKYLDGIKTDNITIIKNKKNYGIATALNQGANLADKMQYSWILTMDQDSIISYNMINEMAIAYSEIPSHQQSKIACLAPRVVLRNANNSEQFVANNGYLPSKVAKVAVITSGNLLKIAALKEVGGYEDKLFIDSVDFDFCLKLKQKRFKILVCTSATMYHSLGEISEIQVFGIKTAIHTHSLVRKYYISRNHVYICKTFFLSNTIFCIKKSISFVLFVLQCIVLEENRIANIRAIIEGIFDGMTDNYGEKQRS